MRKGSGIGKTIEFHSSYFIVALGFILTGHFINLIVFTSLILVHEYNMYKDEKNNYLQRIFFIFIE